MTIVLERAPQNLRQGQEEVHHTVIDTDYFLILILILTVPTNGIHDHSRCNIG